MLRMSKLADYAFIILSQMATNAGQTWSAASLSTETTLPLPTVAKLMKLLSKHHVVEAQRGAAGGYRLARPAEQTTIADIIEAVDGPIRLTECAGAALGHQDCDCAIKVCPVRESWSIINKTIRRSLELLHLSDIVPARTAV